MESLELGSGSVADDVLLDLSVQCARLDAGSHKLRRQVQRTRDQTAALPNELDLLAVPDVDHPVALPEDVAAETRSSRSLTSLRTTSTGRSVSMVLKLPPAR